MAKTFDITISARDKFSQVFTRLSKKAGQTARDTSVSNLAAEGASKSTEKWARGMERVTRAATSSVGALRDAAEPMAAMGAMRFAGPVGAVLTLVAAVGALTQKWADSTAEVGRTSKAFNVDATNLQLWSAAAKGAGYSADEMADSYTRMARLLYLVQKAPNEVPRAVALFNAYGIDPKAGVDAALNRIVKIYENMPKDGNLRSRFAQDAELNESTARFLADGQEKIAEAIEKVRRAGSAQTDDAVRQAEVQKRALGDLANAWDRVRNAVGAAISPAMVGIFDTLSGAAPEGKGKTFLEWLVTDLTPSARAAPPGTGGWADMMRGGGIVGDASMPPIGNGAPAPDRIRMPSGEFSPEFMDRLKSPGGMVFSGPAAMNKVFGENSTLQLEVSFVNAPPDLTVRARSNGQQVPVRISHSSPVGSTP